MSAVGRLARFAIDNMKPGQIFTLADMREFNLAYAATGETLIDDKTLRNRTAKDLIDTGMVRRMGRNAYIYIGPKTDLEMAALGSANYAKRDVGGVRRRRDRYHTERKSTMRLKHLDPLFNVQGGICALCGKDMLHPRQADLDHVIPLSAEGADEIGNLVAMHRGCNSLKSDHGLEGAREKYEAEGGPMDIFTATKALVDGLSLGLQEKFDE